MTAKELFHAGKVREAQAALAAHLRENPEAAAERTFLFELLCFSGDYERARKQLGILARTSTDAVRGAALYSSALDCDQARNELFRKGDFGGAPEPRGQPGTLNGRPFERIADVDPRIGARLEVYAGGAYHLIPFSQIASIAMRPPARLRDLLWTPALVAMTGESQGAGTETVLIPAIYPFSWECEDETVWLGRVTEWVTGSEGLEWPQGQKMFAVDEDEAPLLEVRTIEFAARAAARG